MATVIPLVDVASQSYPPVPPSDGWRSQPFYGVGGTGVLLQPGAAGAGYRDLPALELVKVEDEAWPALAQTNAPSSPPPVAVNVSDQNLSGLAVDSFPETRR